MVCRAARGRSAGPCGAVRRPCNGSEIAGGGHADFRRMLLEEEGVEFLPDGRVDMAKCRYFFGEAPAEDTLSIEGNGG